MTVSSVYLSGKSICGLNDKQPCSLAVMQGLIDADIRDFRAHYRIVKSIGDSHCILRSLATCLNYICVKEFSVSWLVKQN